jgi:hypothetical protein
MWRMLKRFQQHRDQNFENGPGKGVCLTMSCWYLIHAANGDTDYWDWFRENVGEIHRKGNETVHPSHYFSTMQSVGKLALGEQFTASTRALPVNLLQGALGPWRLAVMENETFKAAHAIACYMGLKPRLLDVTDGEFEFDSRNDCLGWLAQHVAFPHVPYFGRRISYAEAFPKLTVYGFKKQTSQ